MLKRLRANLAGETALKRAARAPSSRSPRRSSGSWRARQRRGSSSYEKALFDFDSKYISQPGNRLASEYLFNTYKSFGYEPRVPVVRAARSADGGQTANVVATLRGTVTRNSSTSSAATSTPSPAAPAPTTTRRARRRCSRRRACWPGTRCPRRSCSRRSPAKKPGLLGSREFVRRASPTRCRSSAR